MIVARLARSNVACDTGCRGVTNRAEQEHFSAKEAASSRAIDRKSVFASSCSRRSPMRPAIISGDSGVSLEEVDWSALIVGDQSAREGLEYVESIARYSNAEREDGISAHCFLYREDEAFERWLDAISTRGHASGAFVARLLAGTAARAALARFAADARTLARQVEAAQFQALSPFLIEGTLADYLFHYGMYEFYYQQHAANEALDTTRAFVCELVGHDLEKIVALSSRSAWGDWFVPHSCTDFSVILFDRTRHPFWLFAFTHSD